MTDSREERVARVRAWLDEWRVIAGDREVVKGLTFGDLRACLEPSPDVWEAIETFSEPTSPSSGCGVLVADADGTVGEAYFRNFDDDDKGWWWANTNWGDYPEPDRPMPTHWRPLPDPPKVTVEEPIAPKRD